MFRETPQIQKANEPIGTIINFRGHRTGRIAELVEEELSNNVKLLPSYIEDKRDQATSTKKKNNVLS